MALTLLTRLPVTRFVSADWSARHYQHSAYYYPLIGLVLGAVLWGIVSLLPAATPPFLLAAVVLAAWITLSGALHLDGLADCSDAYFAAHKNGAKALAVMQDPASGAMAIVSVFVVLSLKLTALASLTSNVAAALLLAPMLGRAAALLMMNTTYYAREDEGGMVSGLSQPRADWQTYLLIVLCCALTVYLLPLFMAAWCLGLVAVLTYCWRKLWLKLINGFTGDCLGGLIELVETTVLLVLVFASLAS